MVDNKVETKENREQRVMDRIVSLAKELQFGELTVRLAVHNGQITGGELLDKVVKL